MISIKDGVKVNGLHAAMWQAIYSIKPIFDGLGVDLVITSALDGKHSTKSKHYSGMAVDIRSRNCGRPKAVLEDIIVLLPSAFDCIFEGDHFHIEFDPKNEEERNQIFKEVFNNDNKN